MSNQDMAIRVMSPSSGRPSALARAARACAISGALPLTCSGNGRPGAASAQHPGTRPLSSIASAARCGNTSANAMGEPPHSTHAPARTAVLAKSPAKPGSHGARASTAAVRLAGPPARAVSPNRDNARR